jgi:hypothetical protein
VDGGLDATAAVDSTTGSQKDGASDTPTRWLDFEGVVNARDVGGYPVAGNGTIRWGVLLRGGDLSSMTPNDCALMQTRAVATIIDLREQEAQTGTPPVACVHDHSAVQAVPMPKLLPASEENYLALMQQAEDQVPVLFSHLAAADAAPVYIHCVIGRDRASYATALVMLALGADRAAVLEDFRLSTEAGYTVVDAHLEAILDEIDAQGGINAYLYSLGVSQTEIDALKAWALE